MCFGRALEMEGEFQVGVKCIATEEPEVMAIEMAKMTDAEICQVTQGGGIPPQGNTNPAPEARVRVPFLGWICISLGWDLATRW